MREFLPTIIGVIFKAVLDLLAGGEDTGVLGKGVLIFAIIMTLLGIKNTLRTRKDEKWKGLAIHAAIWAIGYFGFKLLALLVIIVVIAAVVTKGEIFAGLVNIIDSASSSSTEQEIEQLASVYYKGNDEFDEWSCSDCGSYIVLTGIGAGSSRGETIYVHRHGSGNVLCDDSGNLYYPK